MTKPMNDDIEYNTPSDKNSHPDVQEATLKVYDRILATASLICVALTLAGGIISYRDAKIREANHNRRELDSKLLQQRRDTLYELVDAASEIASCRERKDVESLAPAFLKIYYGRAHLLLGDPPGADDKSRNMETDDKQFKEVYDAKIDFRKKLNKYLDADEADSTQRPSDYFHDSVLALTLACRRTLIRSMMDVEIDHDARTQQASHAPRTSAFSAIGFCFVIFVVSIVPACFLLIRLRSRRLKENAS